jgi:hypothetical protein
MPKYFFRIAAVFAAACFIFNAGAAQQISSDNPDKRAEQAEQAAASNNKDAANAIMAAIATEYDGPAGYRMAEAIANLTSDDALDVIEKRVLSFTRPDNLFGAYWTFIGLSRQNTERSTAIIRKAIVDSKDSEFLIRAAAIEALAYTGRSDQAPLLLETLSRLDMKKLEGDQIILTLCCIQGAPKLVDKADTAVRNQIVLKLADVLEQSEDDRVQWYTCTALSEITGEEKYISPKFWRWWVEVGGIKVKRGGDEGPTVAGRDVPKFFKAAAVGKRVVFVIDVSGSMQHPVDVAPMRRQPPPKEPEKPKGPVTGDKKGDKDGDEEKKPEIPPPDYSKVKSKLDLAKVELIHTLTHLPEDYYFNIVLYDTMHRMIDQGKDEFIKATDANKRSFIKKVEDLKFLELTNIHGALNRAYCINMRNSLDPSKVNKSQTNPAWDPECLKSGATTIFFLTDGFPTFSDDTSNQPPRRIPAGAPQPPPFRADGRMVQPVNIVQDIRRLNTFRKVVINTVGIGPHHGPLMDALAKMSGGEYVDRSSVAQRGD